jgi:hypothetical protein
LFYIFHCRFDLLVLTLAHNISQYALPKYGFRREQVSKTLTTKTLTRLRKFTDYRVAVSVVNAYGEKTVETMTKTGEDGKLHFQLFNIFDEIHGSLFLWQLLSHSSTTLARGVGMWYNIP